jgi:dihydrolipoamide dehydrogenase
LERNEKFAGELVAKSLQEKGVTIAFNTSLDQVQRIEPKATGEGKIHGGPATLTFGGGSITVDEILVAAGRTPSSGDLGLESIPAGAGTLADAVAQNRGFVKTDDHLTVEGVEGNWLYAIADLTGRALLTHMGKYQARICGAVIAARAEGRPVDVPFCTDLADNGIVPQVTFTDPEVASVGITEDEARRKGLDVRSVEFDLGALAGTSLMRDNYSGLAKIVVDETTKTLVGATFVGPDVSDLLHAATVAMVGKVTMEQLWHAVPSYPTASEAWLRLVETYFDPA